MDQVSVEVDTDRTWVDTLSLCLVPRNVFRRHCPLLDTTENITGTITIEGPASKRVSEMRALLEQKAKLFKAEQLVVQKPASCTDCSSTSVRPASSPGPTSLPRERGTVTIQTTTGCQSQPVASSTAPPSDVMDAVDGLCCPVRWCAVCCRMVFDVGGGAVFSESPSVPTFDVGLAWLGMAWR